jgi:hypothetical protein
MLVCFVLIDSKYFWPVQNFGDSAQGWVNAILFCVLTRKVLQYHCRSSFPYIHLNGFLRVFQVREHFVDLLYGKHKRVDNPSPGIQS